MALIVATIIKSGDLVTISIHKHRSISHELRRPSPIIENRMLVIGTPA